MPAFLSDIAANLDSFLESLTVLFPGFFAYFVYIGLRTEDFERLKRSHLVLILFFTLLFQLLQEILVDYESLPLFDIAFYFILPPILGAFADMSHRIFVTRVVDEYQTHVVEKFDTLALQDVGNVSRWQNTVRDYVEDGLNDFTKEYYVEVDVGSAPEGNRIKRGFLNGYSDDDIEILRYDDISQIDFSGIGDPDVDENELTQTVEVVPRDEIQGVRLYRVKMEDFELE